MTPVLVSAAAERDLDEIGSWLIANHGPRQAADVIETIMGKLALLVEAPLVGAPKNAVWRERPEIPAPPYMIYYEAGPDTLVLRILHGARDRDAILKPDND